MFVFSQTTLFMRFLVLQLCLLTIVSGWVIDEKGRGIPVHLKEGEQCKIKTGEPGTCKQILSCAVYREGLKNKTIEYSFLVLCSFKNSEEVICCPLEGPPSTTNSTIVGPTAVLENPSSINFKSGNIDTNTTERPSQVACQEYRKLNPAVLAFHILGGVSVAPGEYPHVGGLIYPLGGGADVEIRCASSLISERYVLTAAHCLNDALLQPIFVRFGVVEWRSTDDDITPVDVEIEEMFLHPDYRGHLRYHDIAILRLRNNVEFTPFVRPVCLHSNVDDIDSDTPLVVLGWGVTNITTKARSEVLLMTNVTTVGLKECNTSHNTVGTDRHFPSGLDEGQYCAYDPELVRDACQSDSGGPLELVRQKQSTVVGVVSFGRSCGSSTPSVYARVAYYLDWIESIVWPS